MQSFSECSLKQTVLRLSKLAASSFDSIPNEATTISALVRPFIWALGYNTDDPNEFIAEFPSDFTTRGDCADCAVLCDRKPVMIIECKCCKSQLKHQHVSQLRKYFSIHPSARLGILTNGIEYQFFTDSQNPNIMDGDPFLSFSIHDPGSVQYKALGMFSKGSNIARVLSRMKMITRIKNEITNEINEPYGELARIVFSGIDLSGESYSRVCGYFRPVENWNRGKKEEFNDRKVFSITKAACGRA